MPEPLAICLEDLTGGAGPRYVRCVVLPGRGPGLGLGADGAILWSAGEEATAALLCVSGDDRLILLRPEGAAAAVVVVRRGGRSVEAPVERPVVLLHGDEVEVGGAHLRLHVHGPAPAVAPPEALPERAPARSAVGRLATAVAVSASLLGCGTDGAQAPRTEARQPGELAGRRPDAAPPIPDAAVAPDAIEVRVAPPAVAVERTPPPKAQPLVAIGRVLPDAAGGLAADVVVATIRKRYLAGLERCYEESLRAAPALEGRVLVEITIGAGGRVLDARARGVEPGLDACVAAGARTWRFPEPTSPPALFKIPLALRVR